ncbi:MAG: efflux transporter outer membrane subunit [Acidobacteriaceae bacterium]|nr:efflux transporter outer membrane subunit [Acidobacteriaceae bacterium]
MRSSKQFTARRLVRAAAMVILPLFLSSCAVGPNYQRPKVNTPAAYRGAEGPSQQASLADLAWWEVFKDETLTGLVKTALTNNYDVGIAVTRVEQEREMVAEARAQYFPAVDYKTQLTAGRNQFQFSPSSGTTDVTGFLAALASASWEIDLWGRIRRLNEAARAQYLSTDEVRRGVLLTVMSDTSQAYFQYLGLQLQLAIARNNAHAFGESRKLFEEKLQGGVASLLPVSRATADEAAAAAQIPELERQIAVTENEMSVLLGKNPGPIETNANLLGETLPPEVPAGLPSALLERRPDVLSAEQTVHYANAQIGVATAAFFPQIGLTAFAGKISSPLSAATAGFTNAWSAGTNLSGPIFEGGRLRAQKRQAIAAWRQATLQYQQSALSAFQDVSNALISREKYEGIRVEQARAVEAQQTAVRIAQKRYLQGLSSYYEVLEAEEQLYPRELSLAQTELNQRLVIVQLYKALGGGWNLTDAQWTAANTQAGIQKR